MALLTPGATLDDLAGSSVARTAPLLDADEHVDDGATSNMGRWLAARWANGKLSAVEAVSGAAAAKEDEHDSLLCAMKRIQPENAHRGLTRLLRRLTRGRFPPEFLAPVPVWDDALEKQVVVDLPFLLPHEMAGWFASQNPADFVSTTMEMGALLDEWRRTTGAALHGPPIAPLSLWGDCAPYHTGVDSVLLLLFGFMSQGSRHWITCVNRALLCRCGCNGHHTLEAIWDVVGWSFSCLASGVWPHHDHLGRELRHAWRRSKAGLPMSIRGACLQLRGDWPWLAYCFKVATHSSQEPCFLCRACRDMRNPFTDASQFAAWRATLRSHTDFLTDLLRAGIPVSGVFKIPGFRFESIYLDMMHMADLGITQITCGNILWELFLQLGGSVAHPRAALDNLSAVLKGAAHDLDSQWPFSRLRLERFRTTSKKPRLVAKAAKTRYCVPIILQCLKEYFPAVTAREKTREACLAQLNNMYLELDNWGEHSASRLAEACRRHSLLFLALAREALATEPGEWLLWRWTPKHHMMLRLTEEQTRRSVTLICLGTTLTNTKSDSPALSQSRFTCGRYRV